MAKWLLVSFFTLCSLGNSLSAQELLLSTTGKTYTTNEQIWVNLSVTNANAIPGAYKCALGYDHVKLQYKAVQSAGNGPFTITPASSDKNGVVTIAGFQGIVDTGKGDASLVTLVFAPVGGSVTIDSSSFTIKDQQIFSAQGTLMDLKITGSTSSVLLPANKATSRQQISIVNNYIRFIVPGAGLTSVRVFDLKGRTVAVPLKPVHCKAGFQAVPFGKKLPSGIYFVSIRSSGFTTTQKLEVVR